MKSFVVSFFTGVIASSLLLFIFWRVNENQIARYEQQVKQLADETASFREATQQLMDEAESARRFHVNAPYLVGGYRTGRRVLLPIAEHRLSWGEYPDNLHDAGVDSEELLRGTPLTRIDMDGGGSVAMHFDESSGIDGGIIYLVSEFLEKSHHIRWHCQTADFEHISAILPECRFLPEAPVHPE